MENIFLSENAHNSIKKQCFMNTFSEKEGRGHAGMNQSDLACEEEVRGYF
jgi:hypothetical protein